MSGFHYKVTVDGGCRGNGTENTQSYGSAYIETADGRSKMLRFEELVEATTNNEAEYLALSTALKWLSERIKYRGKSPKRFDVLVYMDSALVINQVSGTWKCKATNLQPFLNTARYYCDWFKKVKFSKITGDEMKHVLGH